MLNSSKRTRLSRVGEFVNGRGGGARVDTDLTSRMETLRVMIDAQRAYVDNLVATRARPEAERLAICSPPESAARIFGSMAMDLQIVEERRKLQEWVDELEQAKVQARTGRAKAYADD